jgi:hypothetical protein
MKHLLTGAATLALILATASATQANDSSAELAQGGLVLTKSAGIEMKSEDLFISPTEVRVNYQFVNTTGHDETVLVAFPMPDITTEGVDDNIAIPTQDPVNFMGFTTKADGVPVTARVEQRVFKNGVDRTALLQKLGVPLAPQLKGADEALDKLSKADQDMLVKLEMAAPMDYDMGKGMEHHLGAAWTLKTTYYWEQVFPAAHPLHVEHRYTPSVGETSGTALEMDDIKTSESLKPYKDNWCVDDTFLAAVAKAHVAVGPEKQAFFETRIEYILKSGANWKSPIGDFRLVVDKGSTDNLMSFCETGVKKISPTQFEVRRTNFLPAKDLKILILVKPPAGM